jgi:hypothetical protein
LICALGQSHLILVQQGNNSEAGYFGRKRQNPPSKPGNAPQDPAAVALIKKMLSPQVSYAGEQVTERGGHISRQQVRGLHSRIRMDFVEPSELAGDIMLIAPNRFRYFHKRTNTLDIAMWPTRQAQGGQENRILTAIREKRISVRQVGQEIVAGRNTAIVELQGGGHSDGEHRFESKFWIESDNGVKLKQEISGPRGLISRSYFTRIIIGPEAGVVPKDFDPPVLQAATPNVIIPPKTQHFATVAEARAQLPFMPLEPGTLPSGFHLGGVWIFPSHDSAHTENYAALLRYTDSVTNFNLFERLHRGEEPQRPNRRPSLQRSIQRWQVPLSGGAILDVLYIGHLAPEQVQAVHDSLR